MKVSQSAKCFIDYRKESLIAETEQIIKTKAEPIDPAPVSSQINKDPQSAKSESLP